MAILTNDNVEIRVEIDVNQAKYRIVDTKDYFDDVQTNLQFIRSVHRSYIPSLGIQPHINTNYNNPDILRSDSDHTIWYDFPQEASGKCILRDFSIDYSIQKTFGSGILSIGVGGLSPNQMSVLTAAMPSDLAVGESIEIVNSGQGNNGTYVISDVTVVGAITKITVTGTLTSGNTSTGSALVKRVYSKTFLFDFSAWIEPKAEIGMSINYVDFQVKAKDISSVGTFSSRIRSLKLYAPQALGDAQPEPIVTDTEEAIFGPPIYTKTWTSTLDLQLQYSFTSTTGVAVLFYNASTSDEIFVMNYAGLLCSFLPCINEIHEKFVGDINVNGASPKTTTIVRIGSLLHMIHFGERCGNYDLAAKNYAELQDLFKKCCQECGSNAATQDTLPQLIGPGSYQSTLANAVLINTIPGLSATNVQEALEQIYNFALSVEASFKMYSNLPGFPGDENEYVLITLPANYWIVPESNGTETNGFELEFNFGVESGQAPQLLLYVGDTVIPVFNSGFAEDTVGTVKATVLRRKQTDLHGHGYAVRTTLGNGTTIVSSGFNEDPFNNIQSITLTVVGGNIEYFSGVLIKRLK